MTLIGLIKWFSQLEVVLLSHIENLGEQEKEYSQGGMINTGHVPRLSPYTKGYEADLCLTCSSPWSWQRFIGQRVCSISPELFDFKNIRQTCLMR